MKLAGFPWSCDACDKRGLLAQLVIGGIFTKDQLQGFGCNQGVLAEIHEGATADAATGAPIRNPTDMAAMLQMVLQSQQQMQQMMTMVQQDRHRHEDEMRTMMDTFNRLDTNATEARHLSHSGPSPPPVPVAKLPKIQPATFDGDMLQWQHFWDSFDANIHRHPHLDKKQKMDYLHQVVSGPALDKIKGLGLDSDSYDIAIGLLHEHYGDKDVQLRAYWNKLHHLPPVKDNLTNLEQFTDDARAITKVLQRKGVGSEVLDAFVPELEAKLPQTLLTKMREMRVIGGKQRERWTMEELLSTLQAYYQSILRFETEKRTAGSRVSSTPPPLSETPSRRMSTGSLVSQTKEKIVCIFCDKTGHFSDECRSVTDVKKRREVLRSSRRCYKCLKQGHTADNCQRSKPCFYCKQTNHHSAVCWKSPKTTQAMDTVKLRILVSSRLIKRTITSIIWTAL